MVIGCCLTFHGWILLVGRAQTHGVLSDVTDGLFHLGRTFVGALLVVVVVVVVDEIWLGN